MTKHTELPWTFSWSSEDEMGWRKGRLVADNIPNGQYNKTILLVEQFNRNDATENIKLLATVNARPAVVAFLEEMREPCRFSSYIIGHKAESLLKLLGGE